MEAAVGSPHSAVPGVLLSLWSAQPLEAWDEMCPVCPRVDGQGAVVVIMHKPQGSNGHCRPADWTGRARL